MWAAKEPGKTVSNINTDLKMHQSKLKRMIGKVNHHVQSSGQHHTDNICIRINGLQNTLFLNQIF